LSFKTVIIVVLLIFVCLLWNKLWACVLIVSVMVRLDLARIVMVTAPLTTTNLRMGRHPKSKQKNLTSIHLNPNPSNTSNLSLHVMLLKKSPHMRSCVVITPPNGVPGQVHRV
jgi:hypothetical protein